MHRAKSASFKPNGEVADVMLGAVGVGREANSIGRIISLVSQSFGSCLLLHRLCSGRLCSGRLCIRSLAKGRVTGYRGDGNERQQR